MTTTRAPQSRLPRVAPVAVHDDATSSSPQPTVRVSWFRGTEFGDDVVSRDQVSALSRALTARGAVICKVEPR